MIALTTVNTFDATIWPNVRPGGSGVMFTCPAATRSATSAAVSPLGSNVDAGEESIVGRIVMKRTGRAPLFRFDGSLGAWKRPTSRS